MILDFKNFDVHHFELNDLKDTLGIATLQTSLIT